MTPAEMVKCALAEVGLGQVVVADGHPQDDAPNNVYVWSNGDDSQDVLAARAMALMVLRLEGANALQNCFAHRRNGGCSGVTVAELLLDPYLRCGAA